MAANTVLKESSNSGIMFWDEGPKVEDRVFSTNSAKSLTRIFVTTLQKDQENGFENGESHNVYLSLLMNEATPEVIKLKILSVFKEHYEDLLLTINKQDEGEYYRILDNLTWVSELDSSEKVRTTTAELLEFL